MLFWASQRSLTILRAVLLYLCGAHIGYPEQAKGAVMDRDDLIVLYFRLVNDRGKVGLKFDIQQIFGRPVLCYFNRC